MDLRKIKKAELHRHLEGAIRFSTAVELAKAKNIQLPYSSQDALIDSFCVRQPMRDLKSVLDKFWLTQSLLDTPNVLERITYEAVEDAFLEGVELLELRYSLSFIQVNKPELKFDQIHQSIVRGLERAKKSFPVQTGLIGIIGRVDDPKTQASVVDYMIENSNTFIGIDLADNETSLDTKTLVPLFDRARKAGLHVTIHAGESPGTHQNVVDSIEWLGAERIGHGLQIHAFPKLIDFVIERKVHLELCPLSNFLTNAVKSTKEHPFKKLMNAGVSVSINSDDPGIFYSDLTREYEILSNEHGLTEKDFERCNQMAKTASFIR